MDVVQKKFRHQFYQEQNIQLRREIRQLDMKLANSQKKDEQTNSCIFLVLGPPRSGKSCLLRTLQFALNGSQGWGLARKGPVTVVQIKRGMRWQVQGVKQVKETERKYSIQGMQLSGQEKPSIRYKKALQFMQGGFSGCLQSGLQYGGQLARVCLICLDSSQELTYEQFTYIRFLKVDLNERHIKSLFLLMKPDSLKLVESQRLLWLENRINQLIKELDIKQRDDIIVFQNYKFPEEHKEGSKIALNYFHQNKVESNQQLNFYGLQLLLKIIRECQRTSKSSKKINKPWICGWT